MTENACLASKNAQIKAQLGLILFFFIFCFVQKKFKPLLGVKYQTQREAKQRKLFPKMLRAFTILNPQSCEILQATRFLWER